jgi:hypothetical protein
MEIVVQVRLVEAYRSSDGDMPSVMLKGIGVGEGWEGSLECVVRGDGLQLDGLRIGDRYQLNLQAVIENPISLAVAD